MKEKLILTGATGFLGRRLIDFLSDQYQITAIGRNEQIGQQIEKKNAQFLKINLENKEEINTTLQNIQADYIIHTAAKSSLWGKYDDFYKTNVLGTQNIIQFAQKSKIKKIIHISTPSVYNLRKKSKQLTETDPVYTNRYPNHYIETKQKAEQLVEGIKEIPTVILRPRGIFGPGDTSILPRFIQSNRRFGIPFVHSGKNLIDLTHVDNVCEAVRLCLQANNLQKNTIYNVTNDEPTEFRTLLDWIETTLGEKVKRKRIPLFILQAAATILEKVSRNEPIITKYSLELISQSITLDISKIKKELGYRPIISIENGLKNALQNYIEPHDPTSIQ